MTQSSSLLKRRSGVIVKKEEERQEQLILAEEFVLEGHDLLWNKNDCEGATKLLLEAFKIQRENLGKHEKDVGWTCSFLGTAFWLSKDYKKSLKFLLEARRIFYKNGLKRGIDGVDQRICCILVKLELQSHEIVSYEKKLNQAMEHELNGNRYSKLGLLKQARDEYRMAKSLSGSLLDIF